MPSQLITATTTIVLGDASVNNVGSFLVWFRGSNTPSWSIVPKGRIAHFGSTNTVALGPGVTAISSSDDANIAYLPVATRTSTDPGTTPIAVTTNPVGVEIIADGMTVSLVCTRTTGTLEVFWRPMNG